MHLDVEYNHINREVSKTVDERWLKLSPQNNFIIDRYQWSNLASYNRESPLKGEEMEESNTARVEENAGEA